MGPAWWTALVQWNTIKTASFCAASSAAQEGQNNGLPCCCISLHWLIPDLQESFRVTQSAVRWHQRPPTPRSGLIFKRSSASSSFPILGTYVPPLSRKGNTWRQTQGNGSLWPLTPLCHGVKVQRSFWPQEKLAVRSQMATLFWFYVSI